jgi:hypothetical protein
LKIDTNVANIEPWFNDKSFNHINKIAIGALVMFTENVNIPKGGVNGVITSIILDHQNNVTKIKN